VRLQRRLEPAECGEAREPRAVQLERGACEVHARDLGQLERAAHVVIVLGVEADDAARARATGATRPLRAARTAHRLDLEARNP